MKLYGVEGTPLDKILTTKGYKPMERCLMLGFTDGESEFAKAVKKKLHKICKSFGAMYTHRVQTSTLYSSQK